MPGYCPNCGRPIVPGSNFCPYCGANYPPPDNNYQNNYQPNFNPLGFRFQRSPLANEVIRFGGSGLALSFTIVFTVATVMQFVADFSFSNLIFNFPMILICIGCWMIYNSCKSQRPPFQGINLMSVSMIICCVMKMIQLIMTGLGGTYIYVQFTNLMTGWSAIRVILLILLIVCFAACVVLCYFYWFGLRGTVTSARGILLGMENHWKTSMFSIVLACISAGLEVVSLFVSLFLYRALQSFLGESIMYYGNSMSSALILESLSQLGGGRILAVIYSLVMTAVMVMVVVMLFRIRRIDRDFSGQGYSSNNGGNYGNGGYQYGYQNGGYRRQNDDYQYNQSDDYQ